MDAECVEYTPLFWMLLFIFGTTKCVCAPRQRHRAAPKATRRAEGRLCNCMYCGREIGRINKRAAVWYSAPYKKKQELLLTPGAGI